MKQTDFVVTLFEGKENPDNLTVAVVMALNAIKQGHSATNHSYGQGGGIRAARCRKWCGYWSPPSLRWGDNWRHFWISVDKYVSVILVWNTTDFVRSRWTRAMF